MSGRRRSPMWPKLVAGIVIIALLVLALVFMAKLFLGALNLLHTDGGPTVRDPQFAEPAETVTPPPELQESPGLSRQEADPSSRWVDENQTPVDMTAEELSRENAAQP